MKLYLRLLFSVQIGLAPTFLWAADTTTTSTTENRPGVATAAEATDVLSSLDSTDPKVTSFQSAIQTCKTQVSSADTACAASQNSSAQTATSNLNNYSSSDSSSSGSSISSSCSGFAGLMSGLQPLMANYNSQCEAARGKCPTSCNSQIETATRACESINKTTTSGQTQYSACVANSKKAKAYAQSVATSCASYKQNSTQALTAFAAAAAAVASMLMCQEDTGTTETEDSTAQCTLTTDSSVCTRADSGALAQAATKTASDTTSADSTGATDGTQSTARSDQAGGGSSLPQSRGAGVSAGGGLSASSGVTAPTRVKLKSDVTEGDYGGGGHGRGLASGGYPDAPDEAMTRALKNADLRKTGIASQFTSSNGRSNWQKVRERYKDNSPSLSVSQ